MDENQILLLLKAYVDGLLMGSDAENPLWNIEKIRAGVPNKWNYIDGCMITAVLALYELTRDKRYLNFADSFVGYFVREDGGIATYDKEEYNLDNINPGKNFFALYDLTGKEKYRRAMNTLYAQLITSPRTKEGNFWHKRIYPNQVWLDGLYMAQPFYMQFEDCCNDKIGCLDSFMQFELVKKHMRDPMTGLYYHGYDESRQMYWADPVTGCSPNFWLRALGWLVIALVDTLAVMDEQLYYEYRALRTQLQDVLNAILTYQESDGMFYQVIDKPQVPGNYLETSGTAILAYGILKATRLGLLPEKYAKFGERAFWGIAKRYLRIKADGSPVLGGICLVAGLGGPQKRDGSLDYYFSEPVVENEAKGVAPMILAYTEMLHRLKKT
ncbi:MAG: glycoside hydrolase family 88 protein [Candidatus Fimivivens sp.]|nr:glycoside hydrolase family 88 protein [Candidatus Fimivivens sp.]